MQTQVVNASYGKSFWKGQTGYVGSLIIGDETISYKGVRKTFMMKRVPISVVLKREEVRQIQFYKNAIVFMCGGRKERFLINFNFTANGLDSIAGKRFLGTAGLHNALVDYKDAQNKELKITQLHMAMKNDVLWGSIVGQDIKGINLSLYYLLNIMFVHIVPYVVAAIIVVFSLIKLKALYQ